MKTLRLSSLAMALLISAGATAAYAAQVMVGVLSPV